MPGPIPATSHNTRYGNRYGDGTAAACDKLGAMTTLDNPVIRTLIENRIHDLHNELATLQAVLVNGTDGAETQKSPATSPRSERKRRALSAAQKRAISRRMKAMWAAKRRS